MFLSFPHFREAFVESVRIGDVTMVDFGDAMVDTHAIPCEVLGGLDQGETIRLRHPDGTDFTRVINVERMLIHRTYSK